MKFLRNHKCYPNHTGWLHYQYDTIWTPDNEITQITPITHVTVLNFLKMKFFGEITEVTLITLVAYINNRGPC